jgi:hypothetical protein
MLTIRQEQSEAFRQHHLQKFEDEMVEHLQKFAPQLCKVVGGSAVRQVIRMGVENAKKYGFTNRGPVRFYIEFMFMFGSYFDTDPQCRWALEHLRNSSVDQMVRAEQLYSVMTKYWAVVAGPKNLYAFAALRKLCHARAADYVEAGVPLEDSLLAGLNNIYPQKCEYLGGPPLRVLLKESFQLAERSGFSSNEDHALMAALTFFLGHGCTGDPLYGWIARRLADKRFDTAKKRSRELRAKAMLYLEHTLEGSENLK